MSSTAAAPELDAEQAESPDRRRSRGESGGPGEDVVDEINFAIDLIARLGTPASRRANISVDEIQWERCVCCGQPATVSHFDLKRRERILVCGTCRPPASKAPPGR